MGSLSTKLSNTNILTTKDMANMAIIDREREEFAMKLRNSGHTCVSICESYPCKVSWCRNETCSRNNEQQ